MSSSMRLCAMLRPVGQVCGRSRVIPRRPYATEAISKPPEFGQPHPTSHPHLFRLKDLTPGIPASEYDGRRRKLMDRLPEGSIVVCLAAPVKYMSQNIFYKFRQASDFWYLTGFQEPDSAVVLEKCSSSRGYRMTLFCQGKDSSKEKWEGAKTGFEDAAALFGADDAVSIDSLSAHLHSAAKVASCVYMDVPNNIAQRTKKSLTAKSATKAILNYLIPPAHGKYNFDDLVGSLNISRRTLAPEIASLRVIKSENEIRAMRAAADISCTAHAKTMRFARPGISEGALAAHFEYLCALDGAQRPAYVPVVASGANALTIHYTTNDMLIADGEVVRMDAGCEFNGYASDITRTFPANGKFTGPQADLYAAVLSTQKALVALCSETTQMSMQGLHRKSCELLRQELNQLGFGLVAGDLEGVLYPHLLSHPIGIDLHEGAHFDGHAPMKENMVITVEPGIYVPPTASFPKHFHNLGMQIEDEVVIGKTHPTVLSVDAPKEIADVEGACNGVLGLEPF